MGDEPIEALIQTWRQSPPTAPSASQLYTIGLAIHRLGSTTSAAQSTQLLIESFTALVESLPYQYVCSLMQDIKTATLQLASALPSGDEIPSVAALQSLEALHRIDVLRSASCWTAAELNQLAVAASKGGLEVRRASLSLLSHIVGDVSLFDMEHTIPVIEGLQDADIWNDLVEFKDEHTPGWKDLILERYPDAEDYLLSLLETLEPEEKPSILRPESDSSPIGTLKQLSVADPQTELQRRIDQVREVLPDLGEGFVEAVLGHFQGDVEQSMAALFDDTGRGLPPQLQLMDRTLPRRHNAALVSKEEEAEAKMITKEAIRIANEREEELARKLEVVMKIDMDEYDDEYDDQYDDMVGSGGADGGLYDDYDAVIAYNKAMRQVEDDQSFWEASRNTNRPPEKGSSSGDERKYRGPDKMRGGRIPGRGRGGRGGRGRGRTDEQDGNGNGNIAEPVDGAATKGDNGTRAPTQNSRAGRAQKARKLDKRRDKQKQAAVKKSG